MFDFMIDSLQLCKTLSILYEMSFDNNKCFPSVLDATTGMIKIHDPWADIDNGEWQPWEILLASSLFTKIMILHLSSFTLFRILFKDCSSKAGGRF